MKLTVLGAALAAATLAQAGAGDYLGAEPRQLGRRLNGDDKVDANETDSAVGHHHVEARAHAPAVKARAAVKAKAAASSSLVAAAASKSKAAAS